MKKNLSLLLLLIGILSTAYAQNKVSLKGKVIDSVSNAPLERATVSLTDSKDSTLITYTLSKSTGEFALYGLALNKPMRLIISFVSYKPYSKTFNFDKGGDIDLGDIRLDVKMMDEVVIQGEAPPIVMKKDTIEFNADAFKTRPNAVLEELLKKLPGLQVNRDGSIMMNGKAVSKLMIDGREFFGKDPKIATKNLDAAIVAKIQVYDDRENDPDHLVSEINVPKIINIKLKKAIKRSIFGKVYAGGGTRDRYETGGLFNMFRDTLQVSVLGLSNNLNRTAFSTNELYESGGFNRSGGDALWNGSVQTGGRVWGGGIEKVASGGFNINNNYGKWLKINLMYFYGERRYKLDRQSKTQTFLNKDTTLFTSSIANEIRNSFSHNLSGFVEWVPDTVTTLHYRPSFNYSTNNSGSTDNGNSYNNFKPLLTTSANSERDGGDNKSFNHSFMFNKRSRSHQGESFTVNHDLNISPNKAVGYGISNVISYIDTIPSYKINRQNTRDNKNISGSLSASYRYPFSKKFTADIVTSASYNNSNNKQYVYDLDTLTKTYTLIVADQTTDLQRKLWTYNVRPGITWQITKKINLTAGLTNQWQRVNDDFVTTVQNRRNFFLLPSVRVDMFENFSINFDRNVNQPDINSMRPVTIVYNPQYKFIGNPDLKPSENINFGINFYKYIHEKGINLQAWLSMNKSRNDVIYKQMISNNGSTTTMPINVNGNYSAYGDFRIGKNFNSGKVVNYGVNISTGLRYRQQINNRNDIEGKEKNYTITAGPGFNISWAEKLDFNNQTNFSQSFARYNYAQGRNQNLSNLDMENNLSLHWPQKWITEIKQNFVYNSQVAAGFRKSNNIISASIARQMLKKDRGEIKLTVYDIFDQNISVYRFQGNNSIYDMQGNTLRRYFLLTYTFKFNAMKTD